jgi:hypothetical protein
MKSYFSIKIKLTEKQKIRLKLVLTYLNIRFVNAIIYIPFSLYFDELYKDLNYI